MDALHKSTPEAPLRSPQTVMRPARLGSFHQCRLSFMRTLLRRMKRDNWIFERPVFDIDDKGVGVAIYSARGPERTYSLVCFAHDLPPDRAPGTRADGPVRGKTNGAEVELRGGDQRRGTCRDRAGCRAIRASS